MRLKIVARCKFQQVSTGFVSLKDRWGTFYNKSLPDAGNGLAWRTLSGGMAISQPGRQSESELVERGGSKFPRTLNCRLSIGANPMGEEKIRDTFWLLLVVAQSVRPFPIFSIFSFVHFWGMFWHGKFQL